MAKNRDIISYYLKQFPKLESAHKSVRNDLERDLMLVLQDYADEIEKIKANYQVFEEDHLLQYLEKEKDYDEASGFIDAEYKELFDRIDHDYTLAIDSTSKRIEDEEDKFKMVLDNINNLKKQAYNQFLELTKEINAQIDHEMKVHHDFINGEDEKYLGSQKNYQEINSEQANRLLWTIEESKNALIDLGKQLKDNSFQHAKYMNESVLKVLESLRDTKNRMTVLFKSTTDLFFKQKNKIERLNHERQKPHSLLNQNIIRQYVKQIREVNQNKTTFEQTILKELRDSLSVLGQRILDHDRQGNKLETEKAIMQYEIVQKKASYLLHKNEAMAELLISKYQNEIKKIKIDSFRRVEEIKLAYYMPAAFFQNSINLYSNFAFYVNESFDELDNLLTDLIEFNQKISEVESNYIRQSAKTVEDYKIQVMVRVNNVTTKLTDLITRIDTLSKDIITLESRNQLEVAEIRKKMEATEINGDYQKYLAQLDNDEYFACFQHDINMQLIRAEAAYKDNLMQIDKNVTALHKQQQTYLANQKHAISISLNEKAIHDLAFDKELAYFFAAYDKEKKAYQLKEKISADDLAYSFARHNFLFAKKYDMLRRDHQKKSQEGSESVVEYVYNAQKLIDLNDLQSKKASETIDKGAEDRDYAYHLEKMRDGMVSNIMAQTDAKTTNNRKAIALYHHHFFSALVKTTSIFANQELFIKRLLYHLDNDFALNQRQTVLQQNSYVYTVCHLIDKAYTDAIESINDLLPQIDLSDLRRFRQEDFATYVILADKTILRIRKAKNRKKRLRTILEHYYVNTIELFKDVTQKINKSLHEAELSVIKNDVLFVDRINEQSQRSLGLVNREYDRLVYHAVRMGKKKAKKLESLEALRYEIETELKTKVRKVNETYMDTIKSEADKLAFIRKEIEDILVENEHALAMQQKADKNRYQLERKILDKRYADFVKAYQRLKAKNEEIYQAELIFIDELAASGNKNIDATLLALEKKLAQLQTPNTNLVKQLETDKQTLVEKRRVDLQQQLAVIEGNKFTSRPRFLEEIETIKARLPEDYLRLYQEMQKAENDFLEEYIQTESSFAADFKQFLASQTDFRKIIDQDSITAKPFDQMLNLHQNLLEKTTDTFDTSIEKANVTKSMIKEEETKTKDRQDRIING